MATGQYATYNAPFFSTTFDHIKNSVAYVGEKAREVVIDGFICNKSTWLSRNIDNFTAQHLPPATAKVASIFIQALPSLILTFTLPNFIFIPLALTCVIGRLTTKNFTPDQEEAIDKVLIGQTAAAAFQGVTHISKGILTKNPLEILIGSATILAIGSSYLQQGILSDVAAAIKELASKIL